MSRSRLEIVTFIDRDVSFRGLFISFSFQSGSQFTAWLLLKILSHPLGTPFTLKSGQGKCGGFVLCVSDPL